MDKLPADLPENWTQGQTISPNGTEVGLTEQHGYNYLNKQVNAAQRAINDIHTELDGVAKETTLTKIDAKIGEPEDTSTKPTIFGKLAEIKQIILEKASEIISTVTGFVDKIGNPDDIPPDNTVFGKLQNIGYIKGSDGSLYETIFQAGTKTLPYEKASDYITYLPQFGDFDENYMYIVVSPDGSYNYNLLKISLSTFSISWTKQLVSGYLIGDIIVDDNYIFYTKVSGGSVVYKLNKSDGSLIGSVSGPCGSHHTFISQDSDYIYTASTTRIHKISKSDLSYTSSTYDFGNNTSDYIQSVNSEGTYLFIVNGDGIHKFSKTNLATRLATVKPSAAVCAMFIYGGYLYVITINSNVIKYDLNLKLIDSSSFAASINAKSFYNSSVKLRKLNFVYLKNTNGQHLKLNLSKPNELYYAESAAPYSSYDKVSVLYGTKLLYLNVDTSNKKFRIVQLNTQQTGVSTIKGYQEVTW